MDDWDCHTGLLLNIENRFLKPLSQLVTFLRYLVAMQNFGVQFHFHIIELFAERFVALLKLLSGEFVFLVVVQLSSQFDGLSVRVFDGLGYAATLGYGWKEKLIDFWLTYSFGGFNLR